MNYFLAPFLIVIGVIVYQVAQKVVDASANPFVVIAFAYFFGIIGCVVGYFLFPRQENAALVPMLKTVSVTALCIGLGAATIEIGFLLAYRAGWNVSVLPMSTTAASTVLLVIIGTFVFRETLSLEKIIGMLMCLGGLILISLKR